MKHYLKVLWFRLSRSGQPCDDTWVNKVTTWVDAWDTADEDVVQSPGLHTQASFLGYLTWYVPRTRCRMLRADTAPQPHQASVQDGYARHRDEALAGAVSDLIE